MIQLRYEIIYYKNEPPAQLYINIVDTILLEALMICLEYFKYLSL